MRTPPDSGILDLPPQELLSAAAAPDRLVLYASRGFGPRPETGPFEPVEHVRVAVVPPAGAFAATEAARQTWRELAEATAGTGLEELVAADIAEPGDDSPWAATPAEARAAVLTRGVELLVGLVPDLAVFHLTDTQGPRLLGRVRASRAAGVPSLDAVVLEHLFYAALARRLAVHVGEALVVVDAPESTWLIRQVFPRFASVWRQGVACVPRQQLGGLAFAGLAELVIRTMLARRQGAEAPARAPAIAAALAAAEAAFAPHVSNMLHDADRRPEPN